MKFRSDFVTNSSSSSFVIQKNFLDEDQIRAIHDHINLMVKLGLLTSPDYMHQWFIQETEHFIAGYTWIDNLNIGGLFEVIDIPDRIVDWDDKEFDLTELEEHYDESARRYRNKAADVDWRSLLHEDDYDDRF